MYEKFRLTTTFMYTTGTFTVLELTPRCFDFAAADTLWLPREA